MACEGWRSVRKKKVENKRECKTGGNDKRYVRRKEECKYGRKKDVKTENVKRDGSLVTLRGTNKYIYIHTYIIVKFQYL